MLIRAPLVPFLVLVLALVLVLLDNDSASYCRCCCCCCCWRLIWRMMLAVSLAKEVGG
jgi:hypothetical protein